MPRLRVPAAMLTLVPLLLAAGLASPAIAQTQPAMPAAGQSAGFMPVGPERGVRMEAVESQYGVPSAKLPPVGEPPIIRWVYPDYTVYFEREYVIHSVSNRLEN